MHTTLRARQLAPILGQLPRLVAEVEWGIGTFEGDLERAARLDLVEQIGGGGRRRCQGAW